MGLMAYHCEDCSAEFTMDERVADKVDLFVKTPRQPGARWG